MFFQLLFIHLFRPFLKYTQATSPLPHTVSPRKLCTQAAGMISKLMRLYKRSHGLRQICNITVYIVHSACTIHLLNLPSKEAKRDIIHGVKHLEEIGEGWLCARRTLGILSILAKRWSADLPEEAATVLARTDKKFGSYAAPLHAPTAAPKQPDVTMNPTEFVQQNWQSPATFPNANGYVNNGQMPIATAGAPNTGPAVRSNSDSYKLPPHDANGLRAQQYPSASATPHTTRQKSTESHRSAASPSDMFGGVDQLLRESQDWVYRDQAQFATGFENWTGLDVDPSIWANGVVGDGGMNGGAVGGAIPTTMTMPSDQANIYVPNGSNNNMAYQTMDWLGDMNGNNNMVNMATYNEAEWYQ